MDIKFEFLLLLIWNLIVFLVYALDKYKAKKNKWRITERALILLAFMGGAYGALLGMYGIRHKTKHIKFQVLVPLAVILETALIFYLLK